MIISTELTALYQVTSMSLFRVFVSVRAPIASSRVLKFENSIQIGFLPTLMLVRQVQGMLRLGSRNFWFQEFLKVSSGLKHAR